MDKSTDIFASLQIMVILMSFRLAAGFLLENNCFASPPCTCTPHSINCSSRSLISMPTFNRVNISRQGLNIHLDNNNITIIQANAFANISSDSTSEIFLYLQNNLISNLSDQCFNGIKNVVNDLYLTNNKLTSLPRSLGSLAKLRYLNLNKNPLINLDSYTMSELGRSLTALEIDLSYFKSWPVELHFLRQVRELKLHSIPFSSLRHDAFDGLEESLRYLYIINSQLEELPVALCHLSRLYHLTFEDNINLSGNVLRKENCHLHFNSLQYISLVNNSLVEFPNVIPSGFSTNILDLRHNNITLIQEKFIPDCRITALYLNNNHLTHIPYALNRIDGLEALLLGHNDILSIEKPDLEHLSSLRNLELEYNKIRFVSNQAFSNNALLRYINLSNNYLKSIPEALTLLPQVRYIFLEQNEIDCTCKDPALKSWNISGITVSGNCSPGSKSLRSFLVSQTPTCG